MDALTTESIEHINERMTFRTELYSDFLERVTVDAYRPNDFSTGYAQGYLHAIDFAMNCIQLQCDQEMRGREDYVISQYAKIAKQKEDPDAE